MISFRGGTHPGRRKHNEDCFAVDDTLGLGLVADGMGGYACGEVASCMVKDTVVDAMNQQQGLSEAIVRAHFSVKDACVEDPTKQGMGSTVIAAKAHENDYEIAWVGDSRAYLWDGQLKQITRDHSYIESLIETGEITPEEALSHPNKNLITQAVGAAGQGGLEVSVIHGRLADGQTLLLCSDGLVDELTDIEIARIIDGFETSQAAIDPLIDAAVEAGGRDNITVVMATAQGGTADSSLEPEVIRTTWLDGRSVRHDVPVPVMPANDPVITVPRFAGVYPAPEEESWESMMAMLSQHKVAASCCLLAVLVLLFILIKPY